MNTEYTGLVIISAPSGCGKDTIIEQVCNRMDNLGISISCTTRAPRKRQDGTYEQHGVEYFFMERSEFEARIQQGGSLNMQKTTSMIFMAHHVSTSRSCTLKVRT
jgi:guanylate kinase